MIIFMTSTGTPRTISFAEVIQGRESTVRVTEDGLLYVIDLVTVMTGKNRDHAGKIMRRLDPQIFHPDKMSERRLSKSGGLPTKLISFKHAIELVMVLPGETAKEVRSKFADIIRLYIAENMDDYDNNSGSTIPMSFLARASMDLPAMNEAHEAIQFKRQRKQLEIIRMKQEIKARGREYKTRESMAYEELKERKQIRMKSLAADYEEICSNHNIDERAKLMFKDAYLNMLMTDSQKPSTSPFAALITNGEPTPDTPISISGVATALGYRLTSADAKRVGLELRKRYIQLHGKPPHKHDQLCDGRVTKVNSYTERDRPLMVQVLNAMMMIGGGG
jgi:hypothetical protein